MTHSFPTRRSSDLGRRGAEKQHSRLGLFPWVIDLQHIRLLAGERRWRPWPRGQALDEAEKYRAPANRQQLQFDVTTRCAWHVVTEQWADRSEEQTSELQSLMRTSYAVFCLK